MSAWAWLFAILAASVLGPWALLGLAAWWDDREARILARDWPEVAHWETHPAQCPICYPGPRAESTDWAAWAREVGGR